MNRRLITDYWIWAGPVCLTVALALLMFKAGGLIGRPAWLFGLSLSMIMGCFCAYLAYRETLDRQALFNRTTREQHKQMASLRETFEEATQLYREKVQKLEEVFDDLKIEHEELERGYERVYQECQRERIRAAALQTSLHDALDELRLSRQLGYLKSKHDASLPPDLWASHRQLREQFDEKSLVLNQTRRRLFGVEGQLFVAQKSQAEEKLLFPSEMHNLQQQLALLDEENGRLEGEIRDLEELITHLSKPKSGKGTPSKHRVEEMLNLQF